MGSQIRRILTLLPLALVAAVVVAACGSSSGSGGSVSSGSGGSGGYSYGGSTASNSSSSASPATAGDPTIKLVSTSKGKILANSRGFIAYLFTADRHDSNRCQNKSGCMAVWPAITAKGTPTAGPGVKKSLLGTIKLKNGRHQVTYAGHPLYGYTGDGSPGATSYIGITSFGGTWLGVNAAGHAVH